MLEQSPLLTTTALTRDDQTHSYASFFRNPASPIYIALCFKWDPIASVCGSSTEAVQWRNIVDSFFARASQVISANALSVVLILDGEATPTSRPCLVQRWPPWNATWIYPNDPAGALTSDDPALGYNEYQVNNMAEGKPPAANLVALQAKGYGKFLDRSSPFLFWEPSVQQDIQEVLAAYRGGPQHDAGFRFATNIDPLQLHLYAAEDFSTLSSALGSGMVRSLLLSDPKYKSPLVAGSFVAVWNEQAMTSSVVRFNASGALVEGPSPLPISSLPNSFSASADLQLYFAVHNGSSYALLRDPGPGDALQLVNTGHFPSSSLISESAYSACAVAGENGTGDSQVLVFCSYATLTGVCVSAFAIEVPGVNASLLFETCYPESLRASGVDLSLAQDSGTPGVCSGMGPLSYAGMIVYEDDDDFTYRRGFCSNASALLWLTSTSLVSGVGSFPHVSVFSSSAGLTVAIAQGDSFCRNMESRNKQPFPGTCDVPATSTPYVMSYTMGSFTSISTSFSDLTACGDFQGWVHGAYGLGYRPSFTLALADVGAALPGVVVWSVHQSLGTNTTMPDATVACGVPWLEDGVVLQAWPVPLGVL